MGVLAKIQKVLAFGRNIEKYARSAQALSKAFASLDDDLKEIWGTGTPKETINKIVNNEILKDEK